MPAELARRRVLFLCIGNSCRSQLAEAFARKFAADVIEPSSAGLSPFGRIADGTLTVGAEYELSFEGQYSKGLEAVDLARVDLVVNITGMPASRLLELPVPVADWDIEDPFSGSLAVYRRIASEIEEKVLDLAARFRAAIPEAG